MKIRCRLVLGALFCSFVAHCAYAATAWDARLDSVLSQTSSTVLIYLTEEDLEGLASVSPRLVELQTSGKKVSVIIVVSTDGDHNGFKLPHMSDLAGAGIPIQATLARATAYDKLIIMDNRYVIHGATYDRGPDAFGEIELIDAPELAAHYLTQTVGSFKDLVDVTIVKEDADGKQIDEHPEKTRAEKFKAELRRKQERFFDEHYAFPLYFFEHTMPKIIKRHDRTALSVFIAAQRKYQSVKQDSYQVIPADFAGCGMADEAALVSVLARLQNDYDAVKFKQTPEGIVMGITHIADRGLLVIDDKDVPFPIVSDKQTMTLFADAVIAAYADEGKYFPDISDKDVTARFGISKHSVNAYREASRPEPRQ